MGNYPPPYPPPPGPPHGDWRYQRQVMREQARLQRDMLKAQRDAYRYQMRGSRRGSILGPLLIIAIGVIFLLIQTGKLSARYFWDWYAHWWPLLLVSAGLIVLLEWVFDQYFHDSDAVPRRRSVGGGVFTLLLLFGLVGIFFSAIRNGHSLFGNSITLDQNNLDEFFGDKHESDQTLSQTFPAGSTLAIDNPRGDVTVSGTSDDNQIHITAHKEVYTRSDSEADSKAQQISPQLSTSGNTVNVSVPALDGARADLTISVPASAATSVSANHGDVTINSLKAAANVTANHGDVELSAITGPVTTHINNGDSSFSAHSITGSVSLEGRGHDVTISDINGPASLSGDFFGTTHLERVRGAVKFHTSRTDFQLARLDGEVEISPNADLSADQAVGPLTLATRNRNITLEKISGDISVTNRNGSVDLTGAPPLGNINVENRNGSVNLTLPDRANFTVQADTTNGDADNDFNLSVQGGDDSNHKSINGTVGKGGPLVRITTTQGDIALKKASISPLPPPPPPPPPISIHSNDGSSVIIGKDGVNITSGTDGSTVVVNKNGVNINTKADGSSVYTNKGMRLTTSADGGFVYVGSDGTHYTTHADGSKEYIGKDGTRIETHADGSMTATSGKGQTLSKGEIERRLSEAQRQVDKTAAERDAISSK